MNTTKTKTRDPAGGLTAAGRTAFLRKEEAQLKPGVRARMSDMTPDEMKRKGSWAVRFYGRKGALPPLKDAKGRPTRFALTAHAWASPCRPRRQLRAVSPKTAVGCSLAIER